MKIAVRSTPSTSQKRIGEPSWSLIRLVAPTGMTKKSPMGAAIRGFDLAAGYQVCVGGSLNLAAVERGPLVLDVLGS